MVVQVNARSSAWLDGIAVAAQDLRLQQVSGTLTSAGASGTTGIAATAGVRNAVGAPLACVWQSGMTFNLNAGICFVQGTASAIAGLWNLTLDTTALLTVTASDPTNPRIDSVIAVVVDNGNGTSTAVFKILPGTPAGSPVAPTLPANALLLANIAVAAAVVVLSQVNFTDKRVWTVASGGILPYGNTTGAAITGPKGSLVYDIATDRFRSLDGTGAANSAKQPKIGAFAPVSQSSGLTTLAQSPTWTTIASVSVTVDGSTEVEVILTWGGFYPTTTAVAGDQANISLNLDTQGAGGWTSYNSFYYRQDSTNIGQGGGGQYSAWITPAAGTHTIFASGQVSQARLYNLSGAYLRARPSMG